MIQVEILTGLDEIKRAISVCINLARESGAVLPFQYMHMPLAWWESFKGKDGALFGQKRGRNFLGAQTKLGQLFLMIAKAGNTICGAAPLVLQSVKIPGSSTDLRVLSFPGDYVLIPFQDFLVSSDLREEVIAKFIQEIQRLLENQADIFWLGYIPESSANLPLIRKYSASLKDKGIEILETITCQRGGVWPWTVKELIKALNELLRLVQGRKDLADKVNDLIDKLNNMTPQSFLFPRTRKTLSNFLDSIMEEIRGVEELSGIVQTLDSILNDSPILYPYIDLPADKEQYLASLSYSTRRYFRRYMKRFIETGGSFELIQNSAVTEQDVEDCIRLHLLRWGNDSAAICGSSADFHRKISFAMAEEGFFSLFFATYKGKRIAVHSCFDIGHRREGYLTGRVPEFSELRAGRLLYLYTIYDAIEKGFDKYELGAVGFEYKMSFTKKAAVAHNFFFYPTGKKPNLEQLFSGFECMHETADFSDSTLNF